MIVKCSDWELGGGTSWGDRVRKDGRPLERKGNLTERSSPRRAFPERSRWVRVEAVRGLALRDWQRLFTPATRETIQAQCPLYETEWGSWASTNRPRVKSNYPDLQGQSSVLGGDHWCWAPGESLRGARLLTDNLHFSLPIYTRTESVLLSSPRVTKATELMILSPHSILPDDSWLSG